MRVSLNWVKKFLNIDGLDIRDIADKLTMSGLEVESVETKKSPVGVVVGKVLKKEKHPNADKLSLCIVTDGIDEYQVVCGAQNVADGQTIPFAKIGAELPNGMKIKDAKLRGVESKGMICSAAELGLEEESSGIMVLSDDYKLGEDICRYIETGDTVFEINITPNRADCLSIIGVAREISVLFDRSLITESFECNESEPCAEEFRYVKIENRYDCPAYYGRIIKNVKVTDSPIWLANRLRSAGIRPINNIVDVTNYIMLEYGQPLHAFDLRMVEGGIVVRNAYENEKVVTLDGKERELKSDMLVIADEKKVLAIAGVMGGEYSGIQNDTVDVFLECAYFRPESIRMTSRRLGLKTDSSYRYERGIDRAQTAKMVDYAASMISKLSDGVVLKGILNDGFDKYETKKIEFDADKISSLIGVQIDRDEILKILKKLGFEIEKNGVGESYLAIPPSYRQDMSIWQDLAEEVARIYGYDRVPVTIPRIYAESKKPDPLQLKIREIKNVMVTLGYNEVINYSFMAREYLAKFSEDQFIYIKNPISADMDTMRNAVFPGVINSLVKNYRSGFRQMKMFEISNVHLPDPSNKLPVEKTKLSFGVLGEYFKPNWIGRREADNFFYLKSVVEQIMDLFRVKSDFVRSNLAFLHRGKSADIFINGVNVGFVGEIHPAMYEYLDIQDTLYIAELDLNSIIENSATGNIKYRKISQFPFVYKDISIVVDRKISAITLIREIEEFSQLIKDIALFDLFEGDKIGAGKVSMTFRIYFNDLNKTLTDEETNSIVKGIIDRVVEKYGATLR